MNDTHSLFDSVTNAFAPIHRDGHKFILAGALLTLFLFVVAPPLGWVGVVATGFCTYFFRDPDRVAPSRPGVVVSAADGKIASIAEIVPPSELALGNEKRMRVSVFLSVLDVHIVRTPFAGRISRSVYVPGKFLNAELDKASDENERQALVVETGEGKRLGVTLIAGFIARRIVTFVGQGSSVATGERIGLIRFGSRVDVYLPAGAKMLVSVGQTAIGGETVLAELAPENPAREAGAVVQSELMKG